MDNKHYTLYRYIYYWLSFLISYIVPIVYYLIKLGITKTKTTLVIPTVILIILALIKLVVTIPSYVQTWQPSLKKGIVLMLPKVFIFLALITLGVAMQYVFTRQFDVTFTVYFECIIVVFGANLIGSIFGAFHQKYKELDLIDHGYVLGVVNK